MNTKMKRMLWILLAVLLVCTACSKKTTEMSATSREAIEQMELGEKYLRERDYESAIEAFSRCIELDPEKTDAYLMLSEIYMDQDRLQDALDILQKGYDSTNDQSLMEKYGEICLELAYQYYDDEEFDSAIEAFENAISADPSNVDAYTGLYELYLYLDEYESADEVLERGCTATNDESLIEMRYESLLNMGTQYMDDENYEDAIPCLEKLIEAGRGDDNTVLSLATAYAEMEEYDKAIELLNGIADAENENVKQVRASVLSKAGEYYYDEGNNEAALTNLTQAIELAPDQIDAYITIISLYMESGQMSEAGTYVEAGVARFMNAEAASGERFEDFLYVVSDYYAEKEDLTACLNFWQQASALQPDNENFKDQLDGYRSYAADEAYTKAEELLEAGDSNGAMAYFKRAFALAPENYEPGVISTDDGTYCLNSDGSFRVGWYNTGDGDIYYFNPASGSAYGRALTGWQTLDGSEYYFMEEGRMMYDEETPDGYYVGPDGKKVDDGRIPEEEEETEEEEDDDYVEDDTEDSDSGSAETETPATSVSKPTSSGELQLNVDLLREAREKDGMYAIKKEQLFNGLGEGSLTLNDIYACMSQYGMKVQWLMEESTYELGMGDMVIWVFPGQSLSGSGVVVRDAGSYRESLRNKELPDGTTFAVQFDARATGTNETVDFDKMESINNK